MEIFISSGDFIPLKILKAHLKYETFSAGYIWVTDSSLLSQETLPLKYHLGLVKQTNKASLSLWPTPPSKPFAHFQSIMSRWILCI